MNFVFGGISYMSNKSVLDILNNFLSVAKINSWYNRSC